MPETGRFWADRDRLPVAAGAVGAYLECDERPRPPRALRQDPSLGLHEGDPVGPLRGDPSCTTLTRPGTCSPGTEPGVPVGQNPSPSQEAPVSEQPTNSRAPRIVLAGVIVLALLLAAFALGRSSAPNHPVHARAAPSTSSGLTPVLLLHTLSHIRHRALFGLQHEAGESYGEGFGDACQALNASHSECGHAWGVANRLCSPAPPGATGPDLCAPPIPGYFSLPGDVKQEVADTYTKRLTTGSLPSRTGRERARRAVSDARREAGAERGS